MLPLCRRQSHLGSIVVAAVAVVAAIVSVAAPARSLPPRTGVDLAAESVSVEGTWLIVLWTDGEVMARAEDQRETSASPLVLGERLEPGVVVEVASRARAILLAGGEQIATLKGPGRWLIETGRVSSLPLPYDNSLRSPLARLDRLTGYREGPLPMLEPMSSQPMLVDPGTPLTLAIAHPAAPVTRNVRPEIRWHWPFDGGRFDLTIEQTDPSGTEVVRLVERWRNLEGRAHLPWSDLEMGATYRISLTHSPSADRPPTAGASASPIVDRRLLHVLAPSEVAAVDGALASLDALQGEGRKFRPEIDVLRARLLESHGLWDEAEMVWTGLAILYPGKDDTLHNALRLHMRNQ